jgi:hypothetical protein
MIKSKRIGGDVRLEFRRTLRRQYEGGMSIRQLAAHHGRSFGNVRQLLVEAGTTLRPRGGAHARKRGSQ